MKKLLFSLIFLAGFPGWGGAQPVYPMGLQLDDDEYRTLAHTSGNIQIDLGRKSLAPAVDLTPYCPEIRSQGDVASCVGWSLGYGAMTIERAIREGLTDRRVISENASSALFIYNQINKGDCRQGIRLPLALELLKEAGNCLARDFDEAVRDCPAEITGELLQKAAEYKIEDYLPLFMPEAGADEKIAKTKLVLAQRKPVVIGMEVLRNFYLITEGDRSWWPGIGDTTYAGPHAMVVVGYDDNKFARPGRTIDADTKGAFKLMNSWGEKWGENGFIWVRYAHFARFCRHAYAIRLADSDPVSLETAAPPPPLQAGENGPADSPASAPRQIAGTFAFRVFTGWDRSVSPAVPTFEQTGVRMIDKGHYALTNTWRTGNRFQLQVKSDFDNGYIYVLSVDPLGKAEVHFPKSQAYNVDFKGLNESAILLYSGSVLTLPSKSRVLQLAHPGKDHLVVLFSTARIAPGYIEQVCKTLAGSRDNIKGALHNVLGGDMIPLSGITYRPDEMGFEAPLRGEGRIVPLLLTVEVSPE